MMNVDAEPNHQVEGQQDKVSEEEDDDDQDTAHVTEEESTTTTEEEASLVDNTVNASSSNSSSSSNGNGNGGTSRLFSPYRTLGIVSSGAPYHLQTHTSSQNALVTVPIGERFQVMSCDRLQPVLVSRPVSGGDNITHVVADSSLEITVAVHQGHHGHEDESNHQQQLTLFHRTRPIQSIPLVSSNKKKKKTKKHWNVVDLLHLGKCKRIMDGEKQGKLENAIIIVAILCQPSMDDASEAEGGISVEGDMSDEDDDDIVSNDDNDDDEDDEWNGGGCCGKVVLMVATRTFLTIQSRTAFTTIPTFSPTVAMHPSTYLNKIVLGGTDSRLILWNVRTHRVIYEFTCLLPKQQQCTTTITALEQSPAIDTIAVGTSCGDVTLMNLKLDRKLFTLHHGGGTKISITSLSFRTDGSAMRYGIAPLAVGRSDGTISIWDLTSHDENESGGGGGGRTLLCELDKVHVGGVAKLSYFPQEPLLLSIGTKSNAIYQHIFDNPDHSGRLLRQRHGHVSPPQHIRYLHPSNGSTLPNSADGTDASSCQIISGGGIDRTLRVFSSARSVLDKVYSQGKGLDKRSRQLGLDSTAELLLPPVTATAVSDARDWGDLVTIHRHHAFCYVWSTKRGAQSGPILRQSNWNVSAMQVPPPKSAHATSVALSSCGNFCIVGTLGGTIYKYNVQSGLARGSYPKDVAPRQLRGGGRGGNNKPMPGSINRTIRALEKKMKVSNRPADVDKEERDAVVAAQMEAKRQAQLARGSHTGAAVTGLAVDSVNKTLISVGADARLVLWNFSTHAPHKKSPYTLPSPATKLCHVRDSDLAAIAMEDYTVVVFDCAMLNIVRRFGGGENGIRHKGPISDLGFSPDGRALFSSSLDGTVRVWDVPTNTCVDWLGFHTPPTSLTVSPTGEFLATTHVGKVGISLWSDKSFYQTVHLDGAHPPTEPARMDDPAPIAETDNGVNEVDRGSRSAQKDISAKQDEQDEEDSKLPPVAKVDGLITLSGMPPAHWKNLFHLELVKERNKPKEAPKKPPSAPFFLQWRSGESLGAEVANATPSAAKQVGEEAAEQEEWDAVWSDDDAADVVEKKGVIEAAAEDEDAVAVLSHSKPKRQKIFHHRSHLASLLKECNDQVLPVSNSRFQAVTNHVVTLGPSAIDVALSTLCNGMHDLEEGLPLLIMASLWLLEACQSRQRYEAVNAYLHRFLYIHANVLAGIEETCTKEGDEMVSEEEREKQNLIDSQRKKLFTTISLLKEAQQSASDVLRGKMQHTLCLLRHFSRMV